MRTRLRDAVVGMLGIEPRPLVPKTRMMPFHYTPLRRSDIRRSGGCELPTQQRLISPAGAERSAAEGAHVWNGSTFNRTPPTDFPSLPWWRTRRCIAIQISGVRSRSSSPVADPAAGSVLN